MSDSVLVPLPVLEPERGTSSNWETGAFIGLALLASFLSGPMVLCTCCQVSEKQCSLCFAQFSIYCGATAIPITVNHPWVESKVFIETF